MTRHLLDPGYRRLRAGRRSLPHHAYLITTVTTGRERRFAYPATAIATVDALIQEGLWLESRLLCWVLMPDHLHALVHLGATEPLSSLVRRMKCITATAANRIDMRRGAVWMPGFHDRAVRHVDDLDRIARYVLDNPVRAGLVADVSDYPYRSCAREESATRDL
jgi:REP element-mobilizing transposase RayT